MRMKDEAGLMILIPRTREPEYEDVIVSMVVLPILEFSHPVEHRVPSVAVAIAV